MNTAVWTVSDGGSIVVTPNTTLYADSKLDVALGGSFKMTGSSTFYNRVGAWTHSIIGEFIMSGTPNYHMASTSMQKARLTADVTANPGTPVQFQVDKDVGWYAGDVLWVSTNGSPDHAGTSCEKITIATTSYWLISHLLVWLMEKENSH